MHALQIKFNDNIVIDGIDCINGELKTTEDIHIIKDSRSSSKSNDNTNMNMNQNNNNFNNNTNN